MIELSSKISRLFEKIDGLVVIYPTEEIPNFWNPEHVNFLITQAVFEVAKALPIIVYLNHQRGTIEEDRDWLAKISLLAGTQHVCEFQLHEMCRVIENTLSKPPNLIRLGFMGGLATSCVRRHAWALCERVEEHLELPNVPITHTGITPKFSTGKILYELTERPEFTLYDLD